MKQGGQALVSIVGPQQQTVLRPVGQHPVRLPQVLFTPQNQDQVFMHAIRSHADECCWLDGMKAATLLCFVGNPNCCMPIKATGTQASTLVTLIRRSSARWQTMLLKQCEGSKSAHLCDQVINQCSQVAAVPRDHNGSSLLSPPGCIYSCNVCV